MNLAEQVNALRDRDLTAVDLVDTHLERILQYDQKLHSFVTVFGDDARGAAEAADIARRSGHSVGPLHGIPIALKDVINIEGRVTTGGSHLWKNRVAQSTAAVATRLIQAGMIVVGKTHAVEFALGGWGINEHMGTPWNPWDMERHLVPGGSSSGSGVAVAAGLVPAALGTDAAGSMTIPVSWCGLTGLKSSVGRISRDGILPLSKTFDTVGPMVRTVEDANLLFRVLSGSEVSGASSGDHSNSKGRRQGVAGLRIASIPAELRTLAHSGVLANYDQSIDVLIDLGANVSPVPWPYPLEQINELVGLIIDCEAYSILKDYATNESPIDENVKSRLLRGSRISAADYLAALELRTDVIHRFHEAFSGIDAIITPSTATAAIPVNEVRHTDIASVFTRFVNLLDWCALALPNGFTSEQLPTSLQIVCRPFDEALALHIGQAYEHSTDWTTRTPSLTP